MPQRCTVCSHGDRRAIDRLLVRNERANRRIAARYGLAATSLRRHRDRHLAKTLAKAQAAGEVVTADELLLEVRQLQERAEGLLETAESSGDLRSACAAIREARGCLELLAKLLGELQDSPTVNVLVSPQWQAIQQVLAEVLAPYPEVARKVAAALRGLTDNAPGTIMPARRSHGSRP
jgi:transposase-like protein